MRYLIVVTALMMLASGLFAESVILTESHSLSSVDSTRGVEACAMRYTLPEDLDTTRELLGARIVLNLEPIRTEGRRAPGSEVDAEDLPVEFVVYAIASPVEDTTLSDVTVDSSICYIDIVPESGEVRIPADDFIEYWLKTGHNCGLLILPRKETDRFIIRPVRGESISEMKLEYR